MCAVLGLFAISCVNTTANKKKSYTRLELSKDFLQKQELRAAEREALKAIEFDNASDEAYNILGLVDLLRATHAFRLLEIDDCVSGSEAQVWRDEVDERLLQADTHFSESITASLQASKQASKQFGKGKGPMRGDVYDSFGTDGVIYGEPIANRGVVAMHNRDYDQAIEFFTQALRLPERLGNAALVRANLGWAHYLKKDYARAAKELRQARQFQPNMCLTNYRLGRVFFDRADYARALESFEWVAKQKECPMQDVYLYLGKTYHQLGMASNTAAALQQCVTVAPRSCVATECRLLARTR